MFNWWLSAPTDAESQALLHERRLLSIDLELTGLDKQAHILSMGWVAGHGHQIDLGSAYHDVFRCKKTLEQSPLIHGIVDEDIRGGVSLKQGLQTLASQSQDVIWVFHNAALDVAALKRAFTAFELEMPNVPVLDTMALAVYLKQKQQQCVPNGSVTLSACRDCFGLASAPAHNALDDAMATLELLFCQLTVLDPKNELMLKQLKHTSAVSRSA